MSARHTIDVPVEDLSPSWRIGSNIYTTSHFDINLKHIGRTLWFNLSNQVQTELHAISPATGRGLLKQEK